MKRLLFAAALGFLFVNASSYAANTYNCPAGSTIQKISPKPPSQALELFSNLIGASGNVRIMTALPCGLDPVHHISLCPQISNITLAKAEMIPQSNDSNVVGCGYNSTQGEIFLIPTTDFNSTHSCHLSITDPNSVICVNK